MTARRRAHACTTAAILFATAGLYAAPVHANAGIAGLTGAILLTLAATSYRRQHRAELHRHERARRAAIAFPDPAPMPDWEQATGSLTAIEREAWRKLEAQLRKDQAA